MPVAQIKCVLNYKINAPTEMILLLHAAEQDSHQKILHEAFTLSPKLDWHMFNSVRHQNRFVRFHVEPCEHLHINYQATIEYHPPVRDYADLQELKITELPDDVLVYLLPSIYCNADVLADMAVRTFGHLPTGYERVKAIEQWIFEHIKYESGVSDALTTSTDTLVQRAGVCRDFAHLGIALCRALGIPARIVVGYVEIKNFAPDFHAIFEAYLGGQWVLFDPTQLAPVNKLIRIATGIDASYVAFATYYGDIELISMQPLIEYTKD